MEDLYICNLSRNSENKEMCCGEQEAIGLMYEDGFQDAVLVVDDHWPIWSATAWECLNCSCWT